MRTISDYIRDRMKIEHYDDPIEGKEPFEALRFFSGLIFNGGPSEVTSKLKDWIKDNNIKSIDNLKFIIYAAGMYIREYPIKHPYIIDNRRRYTLVNKTMHNRKYFQLDEIEPIWKSGDKKYRISDTYFMYSEHYDGLNFIVMLPDAWKKIDNSLWGDIISWSEWLQKHGKNQPKNYPTIEHY